MIQRQARAGGCVAAHDARAGYATGTPSSRKLEGRTHTDVAVRARSAARETSATSSANATVDAWYDRVILGVVKTAISLPDDTYRRVERAAKRLGVSRSEFFARAAERWLNALEDDATTEAINRALA